MRVQGLKRWVGLAVLVCGVMAWAQPTVPVTVVVMDRTGALVPRALVAFSQQSSDPAAKAETDADGRATVALAPGSYALNVQAAGFRVGEESVAFTGATKLPVTLDVAETCPPCHMTINAVAELIPTQTPVLTATIGGSPMQAAASTSGYTPVTVVVTGPDGTAVAGAEIRVTPGSPAGDKLITDEQGRAQLGMPAGEYKLHVSAQGFADSDKALVVADKAQTLTVALAAPPASSGGTEVNGPAPMSPGAVPLETAQGSGNASGSGTQPGAATLIIMGANGQRGVFTPQTLREYPQTKVTVFNPHDKKQETYAGVPLMDLLGRLGVKRGKELMGKGVGEYVVATGSDGFLSVVAMGEADPELHPGTVLVADAVDGKPLDAKAGPFRLVVSEDKTLARSVRNLVKIEVKTAE